MTDQIGLSEFFAMEAGEYLERLDAVVSGSGKLRSDELVQLTRQLRGSAIMAKQSAIAAAAAAFERFARAVKDGTRQWDEGTKQAAVRAVDDFKILVRNVRSWGEAEDEKARALARDLDPEGATRAARPSVAGGLDSGTRAFIGREGATVASGLAQAAKTLQQNPLAHDPLQRVLNVMQPLRGLAVLSDVPPMPDLLDGVERAIGEMTRRREPFEGAALLFNAAAKALARAAQEIANHGRAEIDSQEMRDFAERLGNLLGLGDDVIPIETLYFEDDGPHIVKHGTSTARPTAMGRVELVSHGEHLTAAADQMERASSSTQRELRAQVLAGTFRALGLAGGGPLQEAVARFGVAARDAVARGAAVHQTADVVQHLREAAGILGAVTDEADRTAAAQLDTVTAAFAALAGGEVRRPTPGVPHRPPALSASAETVQEPATQEVGEREGAEDIGGLAGSWARYEGYVDRLGLGAPSLEELLSGPPATAAAAHEPSVAAPAAASPQAPDAVSAPIVPITDLLYTGAAALDRALELRSTIRAKLQAGAEESEVTALIEEVFDLVELGRGQGA